jgi:hypothetical protein
MKYKNDELKSILVEAIGSHQSLDHKLHLIQAVDEVFKELDCYENDKDTIKQIVGEEFLWQNGQYDSEMNRLHNQNTIYKKSLRKMKNILIETMEESR